MQPSIDTNLVPEKRKRKRSRKLCQCCMYLEYEFALYHEEQWQKSYPLECNVAADSSAVPDSPTRLTSIPGFPDSPRNQTSIPGFPDSPRNQTSIPGFPDSPRRQTSIPGFPDSPRRQTSIPGFPDSPRSQTSIPGFPDSPRSQTSTPSQNGAEEKKDKGTYVGVEDVVESDDDCQEISGDFDGLDDVWKEMAFSMESSKETTVEVLAEKDTGKEGENCEHSFILRDDTGLVCRICGIIQKSIDSMIDYQFTKDSRRQRTNEGLRGRDSENPPEGIHSSQDLSAIQISAHPRHRRLMKPHQVEGFNFLARNLVTENPGGCIMAHAPGSGKTFMIISFLQSFMAKYPEARPLVVLPRGILGTWKKEFKNWQIEEDLPLYDFYSAKAENRSQQLAVLNQWAEKRSIMFLGYKQFSSIVCDISRNKTSVACQEILLMCPSILILDEGHTPRNQDTEIMTALGKVQTPRKVVLSGTLYQNHVNEVFNILNLIRPQFLKLDTSRSIVRRILSTASIPGRRNKQNSDSFFFDVVENTLLNGNDLKRKASIIWDLREMTKEVLQYYKGDSLEDLPGLMDFTVFLKLHPKQKRSVDKLKMEGTKFKINSEGSAICVHHGLKDLCKFSDSKERVDEKRIDKTLAGLDIREGAKAKFFLNLLSLCEAVDEKLLVFSQYLLPMKFLERLTISVKGYSTGKEIFCITGDSDSAMRESSMEQFNTSPHARVFFGSIKACGEGISLVGASRIVILDVHLNPSITRQAIGRAFRPGQEKKVYAYRLVASGSPEEEDHSTCFKKESISKMWFEWNEYNGDPDFDMQTVDPQNCGDKLLETNRLNEDIVALYRR